MTASNATFVLVHSGRHNHSTWAKVVPLLEAQAFAALALELPGAGVHAIAPRSLGARLFDLKALAAERPPSAGITQEERTQAVMAVVRQAAAGGDANVILIGHSAGGTTVSAVAEQVPELLLAVVYISDFMAPSGLSLLDMLMHESLSSALTRGLFVGDPAAIGATRIHPGSRDGAYRALLRASFYADIPESEFTQQISQLHCDEPNAGALAPSQIAPGRFGTVPRRYTRSTQDHAIPLPGQDHMIAMVDSTIGSKTTIQTLANSHSPFLSQPAALSNFLIDIGVESLNNMAHATDMPQP